MFKKKEEVWSEKEVANAKAVSTASPSWASLFNFTTRNHTVPLALGTILATASGIVMPTTSIFLGKIFDNFTSFAGGLITSSALTTRITTDCIALIGLGCGTWLLNGGYFLFWMLFGELQARSVRDKLFGSLLEKDMEWFDKRKNGIGAHIPRFQAQIRELQLATAQPLGFLVQSVATALASLGIAFYYSWNLSLVTLATIPLSALILATISSRMQPSIDAQELQLSRASKHAHNVISAIETVKCLNGETFEVDQYSSCIQEAAKNYLAQARANALQIGFVRIMTLGMFIQGFWYGSTLVGAGKKSAGDILTTFWACLMATQAIEQILPQLMVLERGKAAGAVLKAVITQVERRRRVVRMAGGRRPSSCFGDIKMKNVCFTYPTCPDQMVLNDASLQFPANETTFVIGKSGSGKSTLGNLLLKLYSPASGDISIDGNPLQILNDDWIRNNITLVQQQSVLFNESLSTNVGFGKQIHGDASSQEIKEACEFALLQTAIRDLPRGLETRLGNGGSSLSGGQRQRVAIARARLRDTPILILDESTSALDPTSRSLVLDAIRHWRRGKTTIIITHDISQICATDYVYVMDGGRVVQEGIRGHLEEIADGLFASFAPRKDSTVSTVEPGEQGLLDIESPQYVEFIDDARVFPTASISSQDSLEIDYYQPTRFIPSVFAGHLDGDQSPRRRLSDNLLSPLSPVYQSTARSSLLDFPPVPISPLQCSLRRPSLGLVEASGTTTLMRRTIDGGTDRKSQRISTHSRAAIAQKPMRLDCRFLKNHKSEQTTEEKARRAAPIKKILGTVWPILSWQQRTLLILGFLAAFAHAVATPIFSWTFSKLLATFSLQSGRSEEVLKWSLAVLGVAIGDAIASYSMNYLLQCCGQAWVDVIRVEALKRIIVQPRSWFERDKNKLSQLVEYLDRNAEEMKNLVGRSAGLVFAAMTMVVVSTIWSLVFSWKLTLVGLATAPIMYAVTRCFEYVSARWEARSNEGAEEAGSILTETFTNIRIVRALTLEEYFHDKFTKCTIRNLRTGVKRSAYSGLFFGLSDSGIIFITALIFYYGAVLVSNGEYPPAEILTVFTMLLFGIARANSIVSFVPQISSARDTATRLLRLSHLPARRSHECRGTHRIQDPLPIVFNNASFTYPSRKALPVLSRLSLSFPSGSMTAIVGSSGSGKSTIASLLLRLYPPDSSSTDGPGLTLGGVDIQDVLTPSLRAVVALVPQTPFLFPMSIAQNIAYALPALSPLAYPASIEAASKAAGIHDFIMSLPMGYGTLVGDGGQGLSGGQAQRIAIARALIRRPRLLILDEATSALDAESARWFRGVMVRINRQGSVPGADPVTIIAITHDKEMMKTCGDVVVIDQGRVVETGAYKELSRRRGGKLRRLLKGGAPFES